MIDLTAEAREIAEWRTVFSVARECNACWVDGRLLARLTSLDVPIWYACVRRRDPADMRFVSACPVAHAFAPRWSLEVAHYSSDPVVQDRVTRRLAADLVAQRLVEAHPGTLRKLVLAELDRTQEPHP